MTEVAFSKYSGCGNDFILIDNRQIGLNLQSPTIQKLCNRSRGVGADGIILLEESKTSNFRMRIFNQDGSEAEMCGNGLRCLGQFIVELGFPKKTYSVETLERQLTVEFEGDQVKTTIGDAKGIQRLSLKVEKDTLDCYALNTGVPHAVFFVDNLKSVEVNTLGHKIRHHEEFSPKGVNANFVEKSSPSQLTLRTFERGVENETQACGTGATASAIAAHLKWGMQPPIEVTLRSKDKIVINFLKESEAITKITQTGPAVNLFCGVFDMRGYL